MRLVDVIDCYPVKCISCGVEYYMEQQEPSFVFKCHECEQRNSASVQFGRKVKKAENKVLYPNNETK